MTPKNLFQSSNPKPSNGNLSVRRGIDHQVSSPMMTMGTSTSTPPESTPSRKRNSQWTSPSLTSVLGSTPNRFFESVNSSKPSINTARTPSNVGSSTTRRLVVSMAPYSTRSSDRGLTGHTPSPTQASTSTPGQTDIGIRTPPRSFRPSQSRTHSFDSTKSEGRTTNRAKKTPSFSNSDRFIPNRSQMRVDICSANILSAEKMRLKAIEKIVSERHLGGNGNINNQPNVHSPSNATSTSEILTPIQSEYRARLRGTLLNLSSDYINGMAHRSGPTRSMGTRIAEQSPVNVGFNSVTPNLNVRNDGVDLAYASISGEDENDFQGSENVDPSASRMLSFQSSFNDTSFSSFSGDSSNLSSKPTPNRRTRTQATVTPDPYSHDQLHVFDRNNRSLGLVDPALENSTRSSSTKTNRKINAAPTRILDAPELVDDYYLNLISWGKDNVLAVALGQCVYLWNATSGDIQHLLTLPGEEDFVTSVRWADLTGHSNYLAIGTNEGPVQLWDTDAMKKVRTMRGHAARVGSLSWNKNVLSSGGRDSIIIQHDVRSSSHIVSTYAGHTQEVCGLEWNEDGTTLASGGNENYLCIWDAAMSNRRSHSGRNTHSNRESPRLLLTQHQAAVKALAWCPFHRGLLASGGGTADRTIKFWNSNSGALLNSIDTGSQVCSLLWSKHQRELCSSHGFSENQLILWRYPTMTKIQEFKGHTARVLHMEQSPDGASVVSAAADETLRFWDVFGSPPSKTNRDTFSMGGFSGRATILR